MPATKAADPHQAALAHQHFRNEILEKIASLTPAQLSTLVDTPTDIADELTRIISVINMVADLAQASTPTPSTRRLSVHHLPALRRLHHRARALAKLVE